MRVIKSTKMNIKLGSLTINITTTMTIQNQLHLLPTKDPARPETVSSKLKIR
jgi:hypothetical protein